MNDAKQDMSQVLLQIAQSLQQIAMALTPSSEISKPIGEYLTFDWKSIGAEVLKTDEDGPTMVECQGQVWKRRAPDNNFAACIWFSRCIGKDPATGNNKYESLICFSQISDDIPPLGRKAKRLVESSKQGRQPAPQTRSQASSASASTSAGEFGDHRAKTIADLITPKQLRSIRSLAAQASLEADRECWRLFGCELEELSTRSASTFVQRLTPREQGAAPATGASQAGPVSTDDAAHEQEHRQVEAEMKQVYLALGKTEGEWSEFYAEKGIYDLSLPVKREKLDGMKKHARQKGIQLVPQKSAA